MKKGIFYPQDKKECFIKAFRLLSDNHLAFGVYHRRDGTFIWFEGDCIGEYLKALTPDSSCDFSVREIKEDELEPL